MTSCLRQSSISSLASLKFSRASPNRELFGQELQRELLNTVSRQLRIAYSTEQLHNPDNRVMLSDQKDDFGIPRPRIEFKVDDYSRGGMEYAQQVIKKIFTKIGAPEGTWEFTDLPVRNSLAVQDILWAPAGWATTRSSPW